MTIDISVTIGGEAGQGIQTVGQLLAMVCRKAGLYLMAINDFESRIRGGHSFFQIRISDQPVWAPHHRINLLVALNRQTLDLHRQELTSKGLAIIGDTLDEKDSTTVMVPFSELARQAGGRIFANTVAAGSSLALLGAPLEMIKTVFADHFKDRGKDIMDQNLQAAELGYKAVNEVQFNSRFNWQHGQPKGVLIDGSKAIALGALAGDCRMASFYPMSPATSIMRNLSVLSDEFPLVVEQAEDEIAAANMIIGASFAGARSMTATSGGGFCLMTEALGLAGITETPIVMVNAQRPGPATGLATRTAQGDLQFVIHAAQDESPRFVFAPGTPAEAYDITSRAFYLSEKYQVPAIILADQYLLDSLFIEEKPFIAPDKIEYFIVNDNTIEDPAAYKRYALSASGVSPRALPCRGKARVLVSGNEHREDGHSTEAILHRINMVKKRHAKIKDMRSEMKLSDAYHSDGKIFLIGWGSTRGAIRESVDLLRAEGLDAGCLTLTDLWPFPVNRFTDAIGTGKQIFVVEQNYTGQLAMLIRQQTGIEASGCVHKYDGRPIFPNDIVKDILTYMR
jgi:2-oxoglutarate ferredoxin oxidoreductase subunit alpha